MTTFWHRHRHACMASFWAMFSVPYYDRLRRYPVNDN